MRGISGLAAEIGSHGRMFLGLRELLASQPWADPEAEIRRLHLGREANFLNLVREAVFSRPVSPYGEMFRLAGCRYEDLECLVRSKSLEAALAELRRAGVYLSHDEFKGAAPIIRSGHLILCSAGDFRNPVVRSGVPSSSSGSRSRGTRTSKNATARLYSEALRALHQREWEVENRVPACLYPILPSTIFLTSGLAQSRLGRPWERWFTVSGPSGRFSPPAMATQAMVALTRIQGAWIPFPRFLPPNDFSPVAGWIAECKRRGRSCAVWGFTSAAVRVAAAALDSGMDISGTVFITGGEALSEAKTAILAQADAEAVSTYYISEIGCIGAACSRMKGSNSVHVHEEGVAVIGWPRSTEDPRTGGETLLFTTLTPFAPLVLINADMGDAGLLESSSCDCLFDRLGCRLKIHHLYSYSKLTGQGITLAASVAARLLENDLPARFGGRAGDYQLVEQEGPGQTQLILRVSPRTGIQSPARVKEWFLNEICNYYGGSLAARTWRHNHGFSVVLEEPVLTGGKILPLVLQKPGWRKGHEA